jgi:TonB-linked SusC/RagA family outer membrane protein
MKIKSTIGCYPIKWQLLQLIMKTFIFLFCTTVFSFNVENSFSQEKIIIDQDQLVGIDEVFKKIQDQTNFDFIYPKDFFKSDVKVQLQKGQILAEELIKLCLQNTGLGFRISENETIIIEEMPKLTSSTTEDVTSQDFNISGSITDSEGNPLPGASILEIGTENGTTSDFDGNFSIVSTQEKPTLKISFIGFVPQDIVVDGESEINVVLIADVTGLDDVVILGYSSQKKVSVTGAISSMKGDEVADVPLPNITQSLAGRVAGLNMRPNGGGPGDDNPDINIRGIVTTGNSRPLIVVDGIRRDNIQQIDPNSIETVTILKDAAAVAPFGMGGANGVILINTKRGKLGEPNVSISTSIGFQNPTYLPDMVNAQDYMTVQNEGYFNNDPDGTTPPNDPSLIASYPSSHASDPYRYPDSNFVDQYRKNIPVYSTNLEVSGGTEAIKYRGSLGYFKQEGIFDPVGYQRYNFSLALDAKLTNTTKLKMSLFGSVEDTDGIDADENLSHLFRSFYKFIPTQSLLYPGGDKWGESASGSPLAVLNSNGYRKDEDNTLLTSISLEQELPFIKGLSIKGVFSYDPNIRYNKNYHVPFVYQNIDLNSSPYTFTDAISNQEGNGTLFSWLELENRRFKTHTYQGYINYNNTFGNHIISALFVAEATNRKSDFFSARRERFTVDVDELDLGSSVLDDSTNSGSSVTSSEIGYVYRVGYNYNNKYIFEASGRYDGHYSFGPEKRWGYFPAFSGAWRISEEKFMEKYDNVDNLKLRASWGKSGNLPYFINSDGSSRIADFQYLNGYDLRGGRYAFGAGSLVQGSRQATEANPDITWEVSNKLDIGVDLNMWNGLLNLEFDYFEENRSDMLLPPQVTVPVEYGLALSQENKGEMNNRGFEISIGTTKKFDNGLNMFINGNFSYAKNEIVQDFQTEAQSLNPNRTTVGKPYLTPFGYKSLGLFSTADDTNNDGVINSSDGYDVQQFGNLHPGDIRYADLSGPNGVPDGVIDVNDETSIGDPTYPAITYGINTALEYKGFDLALFFQGAAMSSIDMQTFLTVPFFNNGSNFSYEYFDNRWTPNSQNAKYPRATTAPSSNNSVDSDFWMQDTSYLRLKTLILGYTIPNEIANRLGLDSVRLNMTANNLFTISGLDFVDPELGYYERETAYPVQKTVSFGVNINL